MIISPPFLPAKVANETDAAYLDRAMREGVPGDGAFPVSAELNWHGGVHLSARSEGQEGREILPVRAIADGTLAYLRQPTERNDDMHHALNYQGVWTDNGCIVLRHETEIGEGESARVVFYSIYQHLASIAPAVPRQVGMPVYRKDVLGQAGMIDGASDKIHFEIIANDAVALLGRSSAKLDPRRGNGRTDSCWGDAHFHLPPELPCYDARPASWLAPDNAAAGSVARPEQSLFVRLRYAKGQCTLSTLSETGEVLGERAETEGFEYDLYATACERYPACPSAGYELLRWGRVLGPDALRPEQAAHWRQIALPAGAAWVNLNAPAVTCFSDADFPHWLGWQLLDDDSDSDAHCQSPTVRAVLKLDQEPIFPDGTDAISLASSPAYDSLPAEDRDFLAERYEIECQRNVSALQAEYRKLQRFAFRFPSEWAHSEFDSRYGWWLKLQRDNAEAAQQYQHLKAHQMALAFWEDANLSDIDSRHWHLPPRAFIEAFRQCGWLSAGELTQLLPMSALRKVHGYWVSEPVRFLDQTARQLEARRSKLNKSLRTHGIAGSPYRLAAFFGNAMQETQWFSKLYEQNPSAWYSPWDGRGFLQLTHADNYIKYWRFRGRVVSEALRQQLRSAAQIAHQHQNNSALRDSNFHELTVEMIQWRNDVADDQDDTGPSACAYWSWSGAARFADQAPVMLRQTVTGAHTFVYYSSVPFGQVAATVNFGKPVNDPFSLAHVNGIQARYQGYISALMVLSEGLRFPDTIGGQHEQPEGYIPRRI
ncbi:M23 family metallopeptidase [Pseudomonas panipatensis]|uniref:Hydroxyethylthiazole kinase n=1 Tax=Pseudomonas panipatensis TaxID=428992 RepID=A0A1G8NET2_9PSED|nr:M23 family metallopeptidase [Pseudomonas panipatensis]SDI78030.1 hypothetical protein SAMN05216272_1261 [Pseudomonas panipatensis]SMP72411.1 hypothetical protein SAMN06295951_1112 [Pseudomonas panipatensis]